MNEITAEKAKEELQDMVTKEKASKQQEQEKSLDDNQRKALEDSKRKEQEDKASKEEQLKKNAELLEKKPDDLSEDEKKQREVLEAEKLKSEEANKKKEEDSLSVDDKIKRVKEESQKRIDEITNKLKQIEDSNSKEASDLRKELELQKQENKLLNDKLSNPDDKEDAMSNLKKLEKDRLDKYLEDDASKPKEERREITRDELREWLQDEPLEAQEWISERALRRARERSTDIDKFTKETRTKEFIRKQNESHARTLIRHPELNIAKRQEELKKEGKPGTEIHKILCEENEKYRICDEIVKSNPQKYIGNEEGPELVIKELDKRLANKDEKTTSESDKRIETLEKQIEELQAEKRNNDKDEGINSTVKKDRGSNEKLTESEELLVKTMKDSKVPQANIDSALRKFRKEKK